MEWHFDTKIGINMVNDNVKSIIEKDIGENKVFLYMKGTRQEPMCGFSAQVIQVLEKYTSDYQTKNVLEDWDIREGVKEYSSWPTIPQLYIGGKFVGGCDIVMELDRKDKLKTIIDG